DRSTHTATGVVKGKFSYMAPEQLRGERYDHRVDLYAAGVVLFELATGRRLYEGVSEQALLLLVLKGDPPSLKRLDDVDSQLAGVIRRALAFSVDERVQRAGEMHDALLSMRRDDSGRTALARLVQECCEWDHQPSTATVVTKADPPRQRAS